ncbi:AbrB family transcriptional regulator [Rhizobium sp. CG5]|uniref:AbrB family transcriptional regulator n=1 Tax=Rhizobium sp. CG5 TaxID=2726076 RepID=UPI0020337FD6|nr:AbrB family transcriptional regulator [Rhizobium sp. CG5]MCM2472895.1 AbrB family transcriptional regulator [Rhizobium sp. CG5]
MSLPEIRSLIVTVLLGALGAAAAFYLAFPAPFLIGPALVVTLAGLAGLKLIIPLWLRTVCFVLVGISMGTAVTPEVLEAAKTWPLSFAMVFVAVVVLLYAAYFVLKIGFGYDHKTAMLAASPGHLSYIVSLGADIGGDIASISIIQSVRVLALTLTVPLIVEFLDLVAVTPGASAVVMSAPVVALVIAASAGLGFLFLRMNMPAAFLLGGVAVSVATHLSGMVSGSVPQWLLIPSYVTLGCLIGSRFSGVPISRMKKAFVAGAVVTVVVVAIAAVIAIFVTSMTGLPLNATVIAFAPGGLETMAAMAVMMHADATYVGAHHVLRILVLTVFMPFVLRRGKGEAKE